MKVRWSKILRNVVDLIVVFLIIGLVVVGYSIVRTPANCSYFSTQAQAQKKYDNDPVRYAHLDGLDNDDKPCEHLPKN